MKKQEKIVASWRPRPPAAISPGPLPFIITPYHVKKAKCGSPQACVVAQALMDSSVGQFLEGIEVGSVTTVMYGARMTISLPSMLLTRSFGTLQSTRRVVR